jgi:transposase-like protein
LSDQFGGRIVPREPIQMVAEKAGASHDAGNVTLSFRNSAGEVVTVVVKKAEAEKLLQMLQRALEAASASG